MLDIHFGGQGQTGQIRVARNNSPMGGIEEMLIACTQTTTTAIITCKRIGESNQVETVTFCEAVNDLDYDHDGIRIHVSAGQLLQATRSSEMGPPKTYAVVKIDSKQLRPEIIL